MDLQEIGHFISNVGLPGALLIYIIWRLDKFLTFLCSKLETFNKEFGDITYGLHGVIEQLKSLKETITIVGKK